MKAREAVRVVAHETRRVVQTPKAFNNWPTVLNDMARERIGRGPAELNFDTRTGLHISAPNQRGARVPIYEIFAEDCYRFDWFLGDLKRRPINVLDIGGHVGTFACRLAQVHPQATIACYEPSATTIAFLRRNAEQNGFVDRITATEAALAADDGVAMFDDNGGGSGTNGLVGAGRDDALGTAVTVRTVAFDRAVQALPGPVDLVKMDCEGGEYELVRGSSDASWKSVQRLVLEYHEVQGESWAKLRAHFAGLGLTVVRNEQVTAGLGTAWLSRTPLD